MLYREFGIERFQVLTLTTSKERIRTLQDPYRRHIPHELRRPNLFLFAELAEIDLDTDVFAPTWQNANGKPTRLLIASSKPMYDELDERAVSRPASSPGRTADIVRPIKTPLLSRFGPSPLAHVDLPRHRAAAV